jgi:mannan endo-1,4-beta-mannosidase
VDFSIRQTHSRDGICAAAQCAANLESATLSRNFVLRALCKFTAALFLTGCGELVLQTTTEPGPTFRVSGSTLMDPCDNPVILRGVNEMVTFIPNGGNDGSTCFDEIAKTGANSVRLYWTTDDTADNLDRLLSNAEKYRLVPIIYVFNSKLNGPAPTNVSEAVNYWTNTDLNILPTVLKHKNWLVIALRERDQTSSVIADQWASYFATAVTQMRNAGIDVPLAIDAPQNSDKIDGGDIGALAAHGPDLISADQNLLLSTNAWWKDTVANDFNMLTAAANANLPLLVGEFSVKAQAPNQSCGSLFDYESLLQIAQQNGIGWEAWSWGAAHNQLPACTDMDMTNNGVYGDFHPGWGDVVSVTDDNSIQRTSRLASFVPGKGCTQR